MDSTRTDTLPPVELWTITSLLIVALLTFFLPLLTIQIPLMGTQYVSGYDIFSKTRQFEKQLSSISGGFDYCLRICKARFRNAATLLCAPPDEGD